MRNKADIKFLKVGMPFNAIVTGHGHIAHGCPCTVIDILDSHVVAIDSMGLDRQFNIYDFSFEKVKA